MGNVTINGDLTGTAVGGLVGGAANLTTAGAIPYVSSAGVLNQTANLSFDVANNRLVLGSATVQRFSTDLSLSRASAGVLQVGDGGSNANGRISAGQSTFDGLTVGKGSGAVATNTALGASALAANTSGAYSTAVGYQALNASTTATYDVAVGIYALLKELSGGFNTALGASAMFESTSGASNVAVGQAALYANTTGSFNVALGRRAGYTPNPSNANTTGSNNVWIGYESGPASTSQRTNSVAIGYQSLVGADNAGVLGTAGMKWSVGGQTAPTATLYVQDATLVSGETKLTVRAGAGQTGALTEWLNAGASSVLAYVDPGGNIFANQVLDNTNAARLTSSGAAIASNKIYGFSSTTSSGGAADASLSRASAGVLQVGDGAANANGQVRANKFTGWNGNAGSGSSSIESGGAAESGYVSWLLSNSSRAAYMGFDTVASGNIGLQIENAVNGFLVHQTAVSSTNVMRWQNNFRNLMVLASDGTLTLRNETPTTGVTRAVIRAGAGQSTTNLTEWQNASTGAVQASITSSGNLNTQDVFSLQDTFWLRGVASALDMQSGFLLRFSSTAFQGGTKDLSLSRASAGVLQVGDGAANANGVVSLTRSQHAGVLVAALPAAAAGNAGSIQYVTDANATTIGSTVAGGGANKVMVWSDGAAWKIFAS